ncbi:MAG: nodulation protein NfeD [Gracilimonas sp.]|uniref:NfeD family protein n=1 Tax=Gracilimonas sp. TaxID=1974203 RepID=UPI00198D9BE3|nr:nodulation protein NfeD [Gracilimonas sp.]MBD3616759.1 nodulation protein NfeD [Gracilimonas sp.]
MKWITHLLLVFVWTLGSTYPASAETVQPDTTVETFVTVITIKGTIGPTTTNYISRGLENAIADNSQALIIEMDTPGGLLTSTQDIVQLMLASEIPIVVYVTPSGGNAGSAGTFITLAAHIAVMAPTTTIGAASPVSMGGGQQDTVMQKKIFNYSESFIESIAKERDRNAEWAKSAVRDGEAITETEALELNVIDLIAGDLNELLTQIDGKEVEGKTLQTAQATIKQLDENFAEKFFSFIMRPEIMLILTMVAIYGIVGEVTNPGAIVPGVAGVIALILLLYGSAAMPINVAGFILIGLAIVLFVTEAFTPTFGILMTGGAVSFFLGALMLFQDFPQEMQLDWYWLVPATILMVIFFGWIATSGIKAQFTGHRTGLESMIGKKAKVIDKVTETGGRVLIAGEYWNAVTEAEEIKSNEWCEIVRFEGLTVTVKPYTPKKEIDHGVN